MADVQCPIPEVGEALAPWIHSRQETQRIRQQISHHLSSLSQSGQGYDPLLDCASLSIELGEEPRSLDGLHKHYYEALRANVAARENYRRVKQELEELKSEKNFDSNSALQGTSRPSLESYIRQQRQSRQHARLNVIQETLSKLTDHAPRTLHDDLGAVVREETGEAPDMPKMALGAAENDEVRELLFRLKRSLLLAKQAAEKVPHRDRNGHTNGDGGALPSTTAQVHALRVARSQLISWIEGELAKISEGDGDSSMLEMDQHVAVENSELGLQTDEQMLQEIQSLYEGYVAARRKLVRSLDTANTTALQRNSITSPAPQISTPSTDNRPVQPDGITYTDLVTAVPAFIQTSINERAILQQASYFRRQLNAASEETLATVQRLAGESYLVPTDATSMEAWARSATMKGEEADNYVRERLDAGRTAIDSTAARLADMERKTNALTELVGELAV